MEDDAATQAKIAHYERCQNSPEGTEGCPPKRVIQEYLKIHKRVKKTKGALRRAALSGSGV